MKKLKYEKCLKLLDVVKLVIDIGFLLFMIILAFLLVYNRRNLADVFGFEFNIVQSQSMEPNIKRFDFVLVAKTNPQTLKEGDVIAFFETNTHIKVLHRIDKIEVDNGQKFFVTKGDNNSVADYHKKTESQVYAKHIITIPYFGLFITFLTSIQGVLIILINILNLLIIMFIYSIDKEKSFNLSQEFLKQKAAVLKKEKNVQILNY